MKQILVVDDDPGVRELLRDVLSEDYAVALATNGVEAIASIRQEVPDAVVLDMMMPIMDGRSFLLACRRQPECADLRVMVVSAEPRACQDGQQLGAQACVPKPFDIDRLLKEIQRLLT
ncbi:MAG TPA: response regulator [Chloroflexota bacterium]|jgi:CheY-like chemotaxis protein